MAGKEGYTHTHTHIHNTHTQHTQTHTHTHTHRNCIGQEFALNEEKVALAHILRKFEISLDEEKGEVRKDFLLILRPKSGLHLRLKHRRL